MDGDLAVFPLWLQGRARRVAERLIGPLGALGISPNSLTLLGLGLNLVTAAVVGGGQYRLGAALLLVSAIFDMFDGALARATGRQTRFGAFLDSVLDRYSEAAILGGLIYVSLQHHQLATVVLAYAVAIGSLLISYTRARAEGLGLDAKVGIAPRPERIVILAIGLAINQTTIVAALVVLAVLTHVTALQRIYHVWRQLRDDGHAAEPAAAPQ